MAKGYEGQIPQGGSGMVKGVNVKSQPKKGIKKSGKDLRCGK